MKNVLLFAILVSLIMACSPADRQRLTFENSNEAIDKKTLLFQGQKEYDSLIAYIDTTRELDDFYTLEYSDTHQNIKLVRGKLNQKKSVVMMEMEETYTKGIQIITDYYFSGSILIYAKQIIKDYSKKKDGFMEVFTYFGSNKKPIISASRMGNDEEELANKPITVCKKTNFNPEEALNLVNQKGKYQTRFLGSLETENLKFIIVGTNGSPRVQSAIAYNKDFPIAVKLVENEALYKNRLLSVEFTKVTGDDGFTFQGLTRIKILDEE